MLRVTDAAGERLVSMLSRLPDGVVVRIVFGFQGLEFQPSAVCPGDSEFTHQGRVVLAVDPHLSEALKDKTLDLRETSEGKKTLDLR